MKSYFRETTTLLVNRSNVVYRVNQFNIVDLYQASDKTIFFSKMYQKRLGENRIFGKNN